MKFIKPLLIATALMSGMAYANTCETLYDTNPKSAIGVCQTELKKNPNNADLQFYMGYAYYELENYKKAFEWYTKSANQELAVAQSALGVMYEKGWGVAQNYKKAFEWYQKSANQGIAQAQHNLGAMYHNGQGVKKDITTAKFWFDQACDNGHQRACQYPNP